MFAKQKALSKEGLSDSVDLNRFGCSKGHRLIPDQLMAGACRATAPQEIQADSTPV